MQYSSTVIISLWKLFPPMSETKGLSGDEPGSIKKIFVCNLTKNVNEAHLREIFGTYGQVTNVSTGSGKNVTIEFSLQSEAEKATKYMNGGQIDGKRLRVSIVVAADTSARLATQGPSRERGLRREEPRREGVPRRDEPRREGDSRRDEPRREGDSRRDQPSRVRSAPRGYGGGRIGSHRPTRSPSPASGAFRARYTGPIRRRR